MKMMKIYKANIVETNWKKALWNSLGIISAALALVFTVMIIVCSLTITFVVAKLLSFSSGIDREIEKRISRVRFMRYVRAFKYIPHTDTYSFPVKM